MTGESISNKKRTIKDKEPKLIWQRKYKAGYILRKEKRFDFGDGKGFIMTTAYNYDGDYIGNSKNAYYLCVKKRIKPEKSNPENSVCSIGFCDKKQKWYGWSHRAIVGFGIGDMIFKERFGDDSTPFIKHGDKPIKTLADARLSAIRFAKYVS